MRKIIHILTVLSLSFPLTNAQLNDWENPLVTGINKEPARVTAYSFSSIQKALSCNKARTDRVISLDGIWKFNYVDNPSLAPEEFYKQEIVSRKDLKFPPYTHMFNLIFRGRFEVKVGWAAERLSGILKKSAVKGIEIITPASLPMVKRRGSFRRHILLKGKDPDSLNRFLRRGLKRFKTPGGVIFKVDVDPVTVP